MFILNILQANAAEKKVLQTISNWKSESLLDSQIWTMKIANPNLKNGIQSVCLSSDIKHLMKHNIFSAEITMLSCCLKMCSLHVSISLNISAIFIYLFIVPSFAHFPIFFFLFLIELIKTQNTMVQNISKHNELQLKGRSIISKWQAAPYWQNENWYCHHSNCRWLFSK